MKESCTLSALHFSSAAVRGNQRPEKTIKRHAGGTYMDCLDRNGTDSVRGSDSVQRHAVSSGHESKSADNGNTGSSSHSQELVVGWGSDEGLRLHVKSGVARHNDTTTGVIVAAQQESATLPNRSARVSFTAPACLDSPTTASQMKQPTSNPTEIYLCVCLRCKYARVIDDTQTCVHMWHTILGSRAFVFELNPTFPGKLYHFLAANQLKIA